MTKGLEGFLIINIIGFGGSLTGSIITMLWFRAMRDSLERDTILFIIKMFAAIWAAIDILYFIMR